MSGFFTGSVYFGAAVTLLAYQAGIFLRKKTGSALLNPVPVAIVLLILMLWAFGIKYEDYFRGAQYLQYFLTPATVCLAIPLYQQLKLLRKNLKAVLAGITAGVLSSLVGILLLSAMFGFSHELYVTLLPKSITTAIGMVLSQELGGTPAVTAGAIVLTGNIGYFSAEWVLRLFRITEPVAKGLAIGASSHVFGTAKALELGEAEGAMSALAIAVSGIMTVLVASFFAAMY